ncbi:MAG: amino acid adenylation domain-containing protein [Gracilibacteraceae bacterium]|jgi:amino acid adenylation domain-containing protein|nr:amino acid adenylation domain-containing protein [Gracilibacteraceae bacterium]
MQPQINLFDLFSVRSYYFFVAIGIFCMVVYVAAVGAVRYLPWPALVKTRLSSLGSLKQHIPSFQRLFLFYFCYAAAYGFGYIGLWVPKFIVMFGEINSVTFVGFALFFIPAYLTLTRFCRLPGRPIDILEAVMPSLNIMQIFQRLACYFNGCCFGLPFAGGIVFPDDAQASRLYGEGTAVFPTQLAEAGALTLLLLLTLTVRLLGRRTVHIFPIGFGLIGFVLESLTGGFKGITAGPFDGMHLFFLALVVMGIVLYRMSAAPGKKISPPDDPIPAGGEPGSGVGDSLGGGEPGSGVGDGETFPLTGPQQTLWSLEMRYGGAVNILGGSVIFDEPLNEEQVFSIARRVTAATDFARLRLNRQNRQYFLAAAPQDYEVLDFASEAEWHAALAPLARQPMPAFYDAPLYELKICRINGEYRGGFMRGNHIGGDAWTAKLLFDSFAKEYIGKMGPMRPPAYTYRDFILEEAAYLRSPEYEDDRRFWREEMPVPPPLGRLKPGADAPTRRADAGRDSFPLEKEMMIELRKFSKKNRLAADVPFLAALLLLLQRSGDQDGASVGFTALNREPHQLRTMGLFVSTLPICCRAEEDMSLRAFLTLVQRKREAALAHRRYPLARMLRDLRETYPHTENLYNVLFAYQIIRPTFAPSMRAIWYESGQCGTPLNFHIEDLQKIDYYSLQIEYQLELFTAADAAALHKRYVHILGQILAAPDLPLKDLDILAPEDKALWAALNSTRHPFAPRPLPAYILERAARVPRACAVRCGEVSMSYAALAAQANAAAALLRARGAPRGSAVAVMTERRLELPALLLGIMLAGCAYLPIDTSSPKERVDFILADAGAAFLFYAPAFADRFTPGIPALPLPLPETAANAAPEPESAGQPGQPGAPVSPAPASPAPASPTGSTTMAASPAPASPAGAGEALSPEDAAYIIYTSGSTGRPKGARIQHRAIVNRLAWMEAAYPLAEGETLIQKTNYSFDVSVWEFFWPLMTGRSLYLPPPGTELDPVLLAADINAAEVRTIHFVPSLLHLFLTCVRQTGIALPTLRRVFVSGEALTPETCALFYEVFPDGVTLHNLYGPTECAIDVLRHDCAPGETEIPLGRPVWNTEVYALDAHDRLLPPGPAGELAFGGWQLAAGYVDSAQDAGRFVLHPLWGRLYKTGDLGSLRHDGRILFHGRRDDQIKIYGRRMEPAEIETALRSHPDVTDAAVIPRDGSLTAFYTGMAEISPAAWQAYLGGKLPVPMIPRAFRHLDALPHTRSGKLDKTALAALPAPPPEAEARTSLPAIGEMEKILTAVISKTLGGRELGVTDSLAEAGLDSLAILSVVTQLAGAGIEIRAEEFYLFPTIRTLAANAGLRKQGLIHVFHPTENDTAVLAIPYGGGSYGAFFALAGEMFRQARIPLAAAQTASTSPAALLAELQQKPYRRYIVYSCCVGSALAIETARLMEENGFTILGLFLASSAPPLGIGFYGWFFNPWNYTPDFFINRYLQNLSEKYFMLTKNEIRQFRRDAGYFFRYLAGRRRPPACPVHALCGGSDPMLKNVDTGSRWEKYFGRPVNLIFFPDTKHYFTQIHPEMTASHILRSLPPE